jgi:hypothetical protein
MNHAIPQGIIPPLPGLEKEEPEVAQEDDIPSDDGEGKPAQEPPAADPEPSRDVERE